MQLWATMYVYYREDKVRGESHIGSRHRSNQTGQDASGGWLGAAKYPGGRFGLADLGTGPDWLARRRSAAPCQVRSPGEVNLSRFDQQAKLRWR